MLAGYHTPDSGELRVRGKIIPLPLRPGQAQELGLTFVHQDLALVDSLSVLENLRVGRYQTRGAWAPIAWRSERRLVREALGRFGLAIDEDLEVGRLRDVERAAIAIVRALQGIQEEDGVLLVLDEPTAYLPRDSVERLFELVREVAASGVAVLFVSHQLGEVKQITERITVLRNGETVATAATSQISEDDLVELIIGRAIGQLYPEPAYSVHPDSTLTVNGLSGAGVDNLSFHLLRGEVLGLTGLVGMGYEDVPYLIVGSTQAISGEIVTESGVFRAVELSPKKARAANIVFVPANRQRFGIVPSLELGANVSLPVLTKYFRFLHLNRRRERSEVEAVLTQFDVRPHDPIGLVSSLSGGNQQKAVLAKWLQTSPRVLLLHEPTQGVDVGARKQIFQLIRQAAMAGTGVLLVTSDFEDAAHLCDRVLVFRDGRVISELTGNSLSEDMISEQSYRARPVSGGRSGSGNRRNPAET
jgi:ribose transport system ATP-binding protein